MSFKNAISISARSSQLFHQLSAQPKIFQAIHRDKNTVAKLHITPVRKYPEAKPIPLPDNLDGLNHAQVAKWSPHRTRDMTTPAILCHASTSFTQTTATFNAAPNNDPHVDSYDCMGAVSLNSSMQTNVPEPYQSGTKSTHLNMPGGEWESGIKFTAEDMRSSHYVNTKRRMSTMSSSEKSKSDAVAEGAVSLDKDPPKLVEAPLTKKERLKLVFKEYGATIIVFHVTISLLSLGTCYLLVSSGLDVAALVKAIGMENSILSEKLAAGTGTFIAAYALHKCFVPARMSLTLACTPFIVKYLKKIGFIKRPMTPSN